MRFRLQTDYALKALLFLAHRGDVNSTTEEIADVYGISAAHLGRVIRRLQKHGFVKAIRGRRGGVRLARNPETLTLREIIETLEEGGSLAEAAPGEKSLAGELAAPMRAVLRRALGLFSNYLEKVTIASLAGELVGNASQRPPSPEAGPGQCDRGGHEGTTPGAGCSSMKDTAHVMESPLGHPIMVGLGSSSEERHHLAQSDHPSAHQS